MSDLVGNHEDQFSHNEAQLQKVLMVFNNLGKLWCIPAIFRTGVSVDVQRIFCGLRSM